MYHFIAHVNWDSNSDTGEARRAGDETAFGQSVRGGTRREGPARLSHVRCTSSRKSNNELVPTVAVAQRGITACGHVRLVNAEALAAQVGGGDGDGRSGLALVVAAYERWGTGAFERLRGAYAVAIWDAPRRRLVCARDVLGTIPLYVARTPETVSVASSLPLVRSVSGSSSDVNEERIARYLLQIDAGRADTFFAGVTRLPPGHCLMATESGVSTHRFDDLAGREELRGRRVDEYVDGYRSRFGQAVDRSLEGARRRGTWLSGGLDSTSVTCVARDQRDGTAPLDVFSLVFDGMAESDERRFIEAVHAQKEGTRAHLLSGTNLHPVDRLGSLLDAFGEPFEPPNLFMNAALLDAARQAGVDRVLDGFLGDNVVGHGTEYLTELAARGRWMALTREMRAVVHRYGSRRMYGQMLQRHVFGPLAGEPLRRGWSAVTELLGGTSEPSVLSPDLLASTDLRALRRAGREPFTTRARTAHRREVTSPRLTAALETAFVVAAAHDVDLRFPFADRDLVEYCLALPPTLKCREGWTRWVAREAMDGVIPPRISARRSKGNLYPAFRHALLETGVEAVRDTIHGAISCARPYLRVPVVHTLFDRALRGRTSPADEQLLWRIVILIRWLHALNRGHRFAAPAVDLAAKESARPVSSTHGASLAP
jgi:asparagine synthase (glutamine-hydrolysing)